MKKDEVSFFLQIAIKPKYTIRGQKRKRLYQPRQAQGKPAQKAFFAFREGLACDLEVLGAGTGLRYTN